MEAKPIFSASKDKLRVYLCCSNCKKNIRQLKMKEEIDVTRGHYCSKCDDGAHHINFPVKEHDKTPAN